MRLTHQDIHPSALADVVEELVGRLVAGDHAWVERRSSGVRLSARDLRTVIEGYPVLLGTLPPGWWSHVTVIRVSVAAAPTFAVTVDLFDHTGVRSDLTLELTVMNPGETEERVEVDDLHVM